MNSKDADQARALQLAGESAEVLRKGSVLSVGIMVLSLVLLIGTALVSFGRLEPLERQVAARQSELQELEETAHALANEKAELERAIDAARSELSSIQSQVETIARTDQSGADRAAAAGLARSIELVDLQVASSVRQTRSAAAPAQPQQTEDAIARLFSADATTRIRAYEWLMSYSTRDADLVRRLLQYARANPDNQNGVYNTLVVLNGLDRTALQPHAEQVVAFANEARRQGPKTAEIAETVVARTRR